MDMEPSTAVINKLDNVVMGDDHGESEKKAGGEKCMEQTGVPSELVAVPRGGFGQVHPSQANEMGELLKLEQLTLKEEEEKSKDGESRPLGRFGELPSELRRSVWGRLERHDLFHLTLVSRATRDDVLPILYSTVKLSGRNPNLPLVAKTVSTLAAAGQLRTTSLDLFGKLSAKYATMLAQMAPEIRNLGIHTDVWSTNPFQRILVPRLRVLNLTLMGRLTIAGGVLLLDDASEFERAFDKFIPPGANYLEHCTLSARLRLHSNDGTRYHHGSQLRLDWFDLLHRQQQLISLAIQALCDLTHFPFLIVSKQPTTTGKLRLRAFAFRGGGLGTSAAEPQLARNQLDQLVERAPFLAHLYLDIDFSPSNYSLPQLPGLRTLAAPCRHSRQLLSTWADLQQLDALSLLDMTETDIMHEDGPPLGSLKAALTLELRRDRSLVDLAPVLRDAAEVRHLRIATPMTIKSPPGLEHELFAVLPATIETLSLPATFDYAVRACSKTGRSFDMPRANRMNDMFRLYRSLVVVVADDGLGACYRRTQARKEGGGYLFAWRDSQLNKSRAFHNLFGTWEAFANGWWEETSSRPMSSISPWLR